MKVKTGLWSKISIDGYALLLHASISLYYGTYATLPSPNLPEIPQDFLFIRAYQLYLFKSTAFTGFWETTFFRGKNVIYLAHPIDKNNIGFT